MQINSRWHLFLVTLAFFGTLFPSTLAAQVSFVGEGREGEIVAPPAGNINCFDYYRFGSVVADLSPEKLAVLPGEKLGFYGTLKNDNAYPVLDLTLYVRIFRVDPENTDEETMNNGHPVIDQFAALRGIPLDANEAKPINFDWSVPTGAPKGDYQLATYVISGERYNLSGLSFTDDVTGSSVSFAVGGDATVGAHWDKNAVTVNGQPHHFAGFIPVFDRETPVKVEAPLSNTSRETKDIEVTWKTYRWDGQRESALVETKTESQRLAPGETKRLSIEPAVDIGAVTYIEAEATSGDTHSFLNMRFGRSNVSEARVNFPALGSFPARPDQPMDVFGCFHAVGNDTLQGGKVLFQVIDLDGTVVAEHTYTGPIGSAMMGEKFAFTPERAYDQLTLRSVLSLDGRVIDEYSATYDCRVINPSRCLAESAGTEVETPLLTRFWGVLIGLMIAALVVAVGFFLSRRRRARRSPTALSLLLFALVPALLAGSFPAVVSAKTVSWTSSPYSVSFYDGVPICKPGKTVWCNDEPYYGSIPQPKKMSESPYFTNNFYYDWISVMTISGIYADVKYEANVVYKDTSTTIPDGAVLPVGTKLTVKLKPFGGSDIDWSGSGGFNDSPYGQWGVTGPTMGAFLGNVAKGPCLGDVALYSSLQINQPSTGIDNTSDAGVLSCSGGNTECTVMAPGAIGFRVRYGATSGNQFGGFRKSGGSCTLPSEGIWYQGGSNHPIPYIGQDYGKVSAAGCSSPTDETTAIACGNQANANKFILSVPAQSINFSFTAGTPPPTVNVKFGS